LTTAPGRPVWLELNAQRVTLAMAFYRELFAWHAAPLHVAPWGAIPLIANGPRTFANQFMAMGAFATPMWMVRLSGDVAAAPGRIAEHGGQADPGERIAGHATSVFARDPAGSTFTVIALDTDPPGADAPGDPCFAEYWGQGAARLAPFYAAVFGLSVTETATGAILMDGDTPRLALRETEYDIHPPRWIPCFQSTSVAADTERARRLGAILQVAEEALPGLGHRAVLADPANVCFGLIERAALA